MKVERDAEASPNGAGSSSASRTTTPCSTAASACGRPPARPPASIPVPLGFGRVYVHLIPGRLRRRGLAARLEPGPELRHHGADAARHAQWPGSRAIMFAERGSKRIACADCAVSGRATQADRDRGQRRGRADPQTGEPQDRAGRVREPRSTRRLPIDGSSWIAVRCFEDRPDRRVRFAHTGPCTSTSRGRRSGHAGSRSTT